MLEYNALTHKQPTLSSEWYPENLKGIMHL